MELVIGEELRKNGVVVTRTEGDSMWPLLRNHRDVVVIERVAEGERLHKYDVALYRRDEQSTYTLHRVLKVRGNDYVICGDNRWRREYGITDRQVYGRLTELQRNGKRIRTIDLSYRCYVHLWCDLFYMRALIVLVKDVPRLGRRLWKKIRTGKIECQD